MAAQEIVFLGLLVGWLWVDDCEWMIFLKGGAVLSPQTLRIVFILLDEIE